jgi:hypothetical protein
MDQVLALQTLEDDWMDGLRMDKVSLSSGVSIGCSC